MKSKLKLFTALALILLTTSVVCGSSLGWLNKIALTVDGQINQATVIRDYFHCGSGTSTDPFVITRPIHYYHMVELFQRYNSYVQGRYFQLGYDFDGDPNTPNMVYDYDNQGNVIMEYDLEGNLVPTYSKSLNMAYYSDDYALIPTGTSDVPFDGVFDGSGLTIENLNIRASETIATGETFKSADVGIFGYMSGSAVLKDTYFSNVVIDLTGCDANQTATGSEIHDPTSHKDGTVNVGYIAGHIKTSAQVTDVYLNNCSIKGGDSVAAGTVTANNDFGYFGYVENLDGTSVETLGESMIAQFGGSGSDVGWGNTVDMKVMYNRLYKIARSVDNTTPSYPSEEVVIKDASTNKIISREVVATKQASTSSRSLEYHHYGSLVAGSYYFNTANGYSPYIYLTGRNENQMKTVHTYTVATTSESAYYICDENAKNYMGTSSAKEIINVTKTDGTRWLFEKQTGENQYKICAYLGSTVEGGTTRVGVKYYLNKSGTSLALSTTGTTVWTNVTDARNNREIYTTDNSIKYYLIYDGVWQLSTTANTYTISDGEGHYLGLDGTTITTETKEGAAAKWNTTLNKAANTIVFSISDGSSVKYLAHVAGQGLCLSSTSFAWTMSGGGEEIPYSYSYYDGTNTWYLEYDEGWKTVVTSGTNVFCTVQEGTSSEAKYLTANREKEGVIAGKADSYSSLWQMNTSAAKTSISLLYNGVSYYLGADVDTGELCLATGGVITEWNKEVRDGNTYYYVASGGINYYLQYTNKWCVKSNQKYRIIYKESASVTHYMSVDPTSASQITITDSPNNEYSNWNLEKQSANSVIFAVIENTAYYLCDNNNGGFVLRTNRYEEKTDEGITIPAATEWEIDSDGRRYTTRNDGKYYIAYDSSGWKLTKVWSAYKSNNKYLALDAKATPSEIVVADSYEDNDRAHWQMENGTVYQRINGVNYYIYYQGENKTPGVRANSPFTWTITANDITYTDSSVTMKLVCENGKWVTVRDNLVTISGKDSSGNTKYLCIDTSGTTAVLSETSSADATNAHWIKNVISGTTRYTLSMVINDNQYSLATDDASGVLKLVGPSSQALEFETNGGYCCYYPGDLATPFYVLYDNGFKARRTSWHYIMQGGNYLTVSNNGGNITFTNSTEPSEATKFHCESRSSATTKIYFFSNGKTYYLGANGENLTYTLASSASSVPVWNHSSTGTGGKYWIADDRYLMYDGSKWCCKLTGEFGTIVCNSKNLGTDGSSITTTATTWLFASGVKSATEGTISTEINNTIYYLCKTSGNSLGVSTTIKTKWTYDSEFDSYKSGDYYLTYADSWVSGTAGWQLTTLRYIISAYAEKPETTVFLRNESSLAGGLTVTDTKSSAVQLLATVNSKTSPSGVFSTSGGSKLSAVKNSGDVRLTIGNNSDTWTNNNNELISGNYSSYRIKLKYTGWGLVWTSYYMNTETSGTKLTFIPTVKSSTVTKTSSRMDSAYICDAKSESGWETKTVTIAAAPTHTQSIIPGIVCKYAQYSTTVSEVTPVSVVSKTIEPLPTVILQEHENRTYVRIVETEAQTYSGPIDSTEMSGYNCYIPLRLALQDSEDESSYYSDYRVHDRNTGYIVSGSYQTSGSYRSDIRVSNYDTSDIYRAINTTRAPSYDSSYDAKLQVVTKTAYTYKNNLGTNGYVRIEDDHNKKNMSSYDSGLPSKYVNYQTLGLTKYEDTKNSEGEAVIQSRTAFGNMLKGSNDVYGLHFMESTISTDHIIYADQVTILSNTYQNYELPEDAIDFKVKDRGAINFFAGTYYSYDVDAFFSLHHITRDSYQHITSIKEIKKIYSKEKKPYVYVYKNGEISDSSYKTVSELTAAGYELTFDLEWITNPASIIQNAVYYFEIPVNRGEYALGSVEGNIGAYLLYLDIATKGGDVEYGKISSEGSGVSNLFKVDYRTAPDKLGTIGGKDVPSLLQFEINAPADSGDKFSVTTSYTPKTEGGMYTITIKNQTATETSLGNDLNLIMFMVDNDSDPNNVYPYSYKVVYENASHPKGTTMKIDDVEEFSTCQEYVIPARGDAYIFGD